MFEDEPSGRRGGGQGLLRQASNAALVFKDDVQSVAKAKEFEDAHHEQRKRVATCCAINGFSLAGALFAAFFFYFALDRTGLWSVGRRHAAEER